MDLKKLYILFISLISLILVYTFITSGSQEKKKKKLSADQLTLLLGGGSSGSTDGNTKKGYRKSPGSSVFDEGDFMNVGINKDYDEDVASNNPKGEAPINPQTGKPYDDETMEQFEKLSLYFPGNDLIPKRMTLGEKEAKEKEAEEMARIAISLQSGKASNRDVTTYYKSQEKVLNDRIEIIEYLIDAQKEDSSFNKDNEIQFDKILDGAKEQLKTMESEKLEALKKAVN
jgi:hypothetical protein